MDGACRLAIIPPCLSLTNVDSSGAEHALKTSIGGNAFSHGDLTQGALTLGETALWLNLASAYLTAWVNAFATKFGDEEGVSV